MGDQEKKEFREEFAQLMSTETANDIISIMAFTIDKTPTKIDDNFAENADLVTDLIADKIHEISTREVTEKEVKASVMRILKKIAQKTEKKLDDRIVAMLDLFI